MEQVDEVFISALNSYKKHNNLANYRDLANALGVSPSMISTWYTKPGASISRKVWDRVKGELSKHMDEVVVGNDRTIAELERFSDVEDDKFIMAKLAFELGELKAIIPDNLAKLSGPKQDALIQIMQGISKLLK